MNIKKNPSLNPFCPLPEEYKDDSKVNKPFQLAEKYSHRVKKVIDVGFMEKYSEQLIEDLKNEDVTWIQVPPKKEIS